MRAWWWTLITAHLVWGNPDRFKDDYGNAISLETNQNSETEEKVYPSFILSPNAFYARISSSEGDGREKKQMRFHAWGGKRYGDEEEEEVEDNNDAEENIVVHEPANEDSMTEVSLYPSSNASHLETDNLGNHFRKAFTKRMKSSPAFSSWGGKRDPEMMNDLSKRSNLYDPIFQQSSLDSKLEQSRKRYPSFSSWAGKRAAAFNSWGGKRDFSTENRDSARAKRNHSQAQIGFNDGTINWIDLNNENSPGYTSFNSDSLDSEDNLNVQDHDPDNNQEQSSRTTNDDTEHHLPVERHFVPDYENPTSKRAAAFNSWGGKRMSEENTVMMKKPVSFNSWAGKRAAAFNSWAGKRAAAFNSWGGKRAAAFNSWGGKRAAAFNSWGGKRAAAFNSWGGKRAPAFNSWGGKRAAAFNSWGGKRAAAFNSWGGKRAAAFNSWGGKRAAAFNSWGGKRAAAFNSWGGKRAAAFNSWGGRDVDKEFNNPEFEYPNWTRDGDLYGIHFPAINSHDKNVEQNNNEVLYETDQLKSNQDYIVKNAPEKNVGEINDKMLKHYYYLWLNYKPLQTVNTEELSSQEKGDKQKTFELVGHNESLQKRILPSFTSWASKRSPLFSPWYGGKIPTMLLTSGKRRPAFSSWGGKRSEHKVVPQLDCSPESTADEDTTQQKPEEVRSEELSPPEKKTYGREKREVECGGEKHDSALTIKRDKRASGSFLKNRVFTRMMLQGGWPVAFQPMSHGKDFFAWGGKRSSGVTT